MIEGPVKVACPFLTGSNLLIPCVIALPYFTLEDRYVTNERSRPESFLCANDGVCVAN